MQKNLRDADSIVHLMWRELWNIRMQGSLRMMILVGVANLETFF